MNDWAGGKTLLWWAQSRDMDGRYACAYIFVMLAAVSCDSCWVKRFTREECGCEFRKSLPRVCGYDNALGYCYIGTFLGLLFWENIACIDVMFSHGKVLRNRTDISNKWDWKFHENLLKIVLYLITRVLFYISKEIRPSRRLKKTVISVDWWCCLHWNE